MFVDPLGISSVTLPSAQLRVQRRVEQNVPAFDVPVDQLLAVERKEPPAHSPSCQENTAIT